MNKLNKNIVIVASLTLILGLVVFRLLQNQQEVKAEVYRKDASLRTVIQTVTVAEQSVTQSTPFIGSFMPNREVSIAAETSGKVVVVGVNEGDVVKSGTLIAKLDDDLLLAQLLSAQASFDNAEKTLTRYKQAESGISEIQLDNAQTQYLVTKAQVNLLKKQISQHAISAPFPGVITSRNFELGTIVSPGTPLANLVDINKLKLEISVPETEASVIKTGIGVDVTSDLYPDAVFKGVVGFVSAKADASRNYTVKILVDNNPETPLKAGMYGRVILSNTPNAKSFSLPRAAIVGSTINPQVFVIANGVARLRSVSIGSGNENSVFITNGLQNDEVVAVSGLVNLYEGCPVAVVN
ncbi:MAG: efflux RND transporter periplasmic adaptor subunit [Breznakibacter sp.]